MGSVILNAFTDDAGLEAGVFYNASEPQVGVNKGEYAGESSDLTFPKIQPAPPGKTAEKAAQFRRVPSYTDPLTVRTCPGFSLCIARFVLSITLLQPSAHKVAHTTLHYSSSNHRPTGLSAKGV